MNWKHYEELNTIDEFVKPTNEGYFRFTTVSKFNLPLIMVPVSI